MTNDYNSWIKENKTFLNKLANHNSLLYDNLNDVVKVVDYINSGKPVPKDIDSKLFFDTGYAYLNTTVSELKLYLEKYFNNDIHILLEYESLIFYSLYLDEIKMLIIDQNKYTETIKAEFDRILQEIEDTLSQRRPFSDDMITDFNIALESVLPKDVTYITIPEIFFRAAEELNIM
jgi:hypothetical protein